MIRQYFSPGVYDSMFVNVKILNVRANTFTCKRLAKLDGSSLFVKVSNSPFDAAPCVCFKLILTLLDLLNQVWTLPHEVPIAIQ